MSHSSSSTESASEITAPRNRAVLRMRMLAFAMCAVLLDSGSPPNALGQATKIPEPNPRAEPGAAPACVRRKGDALDFSGTNVVSTVLGEETPEDGIKHLANQRDGLTTVEGIQGLPSRHLNRRPEKKDFGYVYFSIHPTFKSTELRNARIEIEYYTATPLYLRLQYDGMEGETPRIYKPVLPEGGRRVNFGNVATFGGLAGSNHFQTAVFHVTNAAFLNSQNGGADFRLEVNPPEIYIRRVAVIREGAKDGLSQ